MKFLVGDLIVGKQEFSSEYNITSSSMGFIGEVLETEELFAGEAHIFVKVVQCKNKRYIGSSFWVLGEHFSLLKDNEVTIKKLKDREGK